MRHKRQGQSGLWRDFSPRGRKQSPERVSAWRRTYCVRLEKQVNNRMPIAMPRRRRFHGTEETTTETKKFKIADLVCTNGFQPYSVVCLSSEQTEKSLATGQPHTRVLDFVRS